MTLFPGLIWQKEAYLQDKIKLFMQICFVCLKCFKYKLLFNQYSFPSDANLFCAKCYLRKYMIWEEKNKFLENIICTVLISNFFNFVTHVSYTSMLFVFSNHIVCACKVGWAIFFKLKTLILVNCVNVK